MEKSDTSLWVGKLPRDISLTEIEKEFNKFGKIVETQMRNGYAFIEYEHSKEAKTAQSEMDGYKFDKYPISVQFKVKEDRRRGSGRSGPTSNDICFNCGKLGHWANECRENDWRQKNLLYQTQQRSKRSSNKCRYCRKFGHSERECRYKSRSRSSSRSGSRSSSGRKKYQKSRKQRKSRSYSSKSKSKSRSPKKSNHEKPHSKRKSSSKSHSEERHRKK